MARETSNTGFIDGRFHDNGLSGVIVVLGQPGTGKSYLVQRMIRKASRVLFYDSVNQAGDGERQNSLPGFGVITSLPELVEFWNRKRAGKFKILYKPLTPKPPGWNDRKGGPWRDEEFRRVAALAWEVRDIVFAVDEVWRFCTPSSMPQPLEDMAFTGRHRGITLIATAQRSAMVAKGLISIATDLRSFRLTLPHDLEALRGNLPQGAIERLPVLPNRQYIRRDPDNYEAWNLEKSS